MLQLTVKYMRASRRMRCAPSNVCARLGVRFRCHSCGREATTWHIGQRNMSSPDPGPVAQPPRCVVAKRSDMADIIDEERRRLRQRVEAAPELIEHAHELIRWANREWSRGFQLQTRRTVIGRANRMLEFAERLTDGTAEREFEARALSYVLKTSKIASSESGEGGTHIPAMPASELDPAADNIPEKFLHRYERHDVAEQMNAEIRAECEGKGLELPDIPLATCEHCHAETVVARETGDRVCPVCAHRTPYLNRATDVVEYCVESSSGANEAGSDAHKRFMQVWNRAQMLRPQDAAYVSDELAEEAASWILDNHSATKLWTVTPQTVHRAVAAVVHARVARRGGKYLTCERYAVPLRVHYWATITGNSPPRATETETECAVEMFDALLNAYPEEPFMQNLDFVAGNLCVNVGRADMAAFFTVCLDDQSKLEYDVAWNRVAARVGAVASASHERANRGRYVRPDTPAA